MQRLGCMHIFKPFFIIYGINVQHRNEYDTIVMIRIL